MVLPRGHKGMQKPILGIPCSLKTPDGRRAVRIALQRIRERFPHDFARLKERIRDIKPISRRQAADDTVGEWKRLRPHADPFRPGANDGVLWLLEQHDNLIASVAHELGHACTRYEDLERRGACSDEWRSELAADWYAYRWGFGREIARDRKSRVWLHHGPAPGTEDTVESDDGQENTYFVTRNFVVQWIC